MIEEDKQYAKYVIYREAETEIVEPRRFSLLRPGSKPKVFTTFVSHQPQPSGAHALFRLDLHLARLLADAQRLDLLRPAAAGALQGQIRQQVFEHTADFLSSYKEKVEQLRVRLLLGERSWELFIDSYRNPWCGLKGIAASLLDFQRQIPELKTNLIEASLAARAEAERRGCQEALLCDEKGIVREGAWSSLFWVDAAGRLGTTKEKVLPGITARVISSLHRVERNDIAAGRLAEAKELFVTQSSSGITPVVKLDGRAVGSGQPGAVTRLLQQLYKKAIENKSEYL